MNALGLGIGWAAFAALAAAALAGRALGRRRGPRGRALGLHVTLGVGLLVLTVAHLSTSAGAMATADPTGIWLATFALVAMLAQIALGVTLMGPRPGGRTLFLTHRITFGLIAALAVLHVVLDRP